VSRARKAPEPTLDNGMGNELLALDFREMKEKCIGYGGSPHAAGMRAAQLVVFKLANRAGHVVIQQGSETECARCGAHGVVSPEGLHAGTWRSTHDFSQPCSKEVRS
jgi:hypothetical protein